MDYRLQDKIDNYHSGLMSSEEMVKFESDLTSDPSLKTESDLQGEIIEGLKQYRKSELKARLNAVDLAPSWVEFVQQSTLMKSFGGVAVATVIGAGIYFYGEPVDELPAGADVVVEGPTYESPEFVWSLGDEKENESAIVKDNKVAQATIEAPVSKDSKLTSNAAVSSVEAVVSEAETKETKKEVPFTPDFNAPNAKSIEDEEVLKTAVLEELPEKSSTVIANEPIDVKTEITKGLNIKYKYYDGKLFLSGDFDRAPYEILEINSASGRRIYVKYLDKYYQVGVTDRLSNLPQVTDVATIDELKLLRKNK